MFDCRGGAKPRLGLAPTTLCLVSVAGAAEAASVDVDASAGPSPVEAVVVTARKPSLQVLTERLQDTPQSVGVVPREVLEDQGVSNLQDALRNVPGVTLNAGEGGSHGDSINLRGFPASDDFFLDGLRDTGFYTRDSFDLESVEVYKGPASTLFGRGSTGGVVNQVSKSPTLQPFADGALTVGGRQDYRGVADVDVAVGPSAAIRLNAMGQTSKVEDRDFVQTRRWGVAPSLSLGIGGRARLTIRYLHQSEDNIPDYGVPFLGSGPAPVARNLYYGLPSDDRSTAQVDVATVQFAHDISDPVTFKDSARYGRYAFDTRQTAPHYGAAPPAPGAPLASIVVYRDRPSTGGVVDTLMNEASFTAKFATGALSHTLVVGLDLDRETASLVRYANQMSAIAPTPLLNPDPYEAFPGHQTAVRQAPVTKTDTVSGFIADTVDIGAHWQVVGAVRFDRFSARFDEPFTNAHFTHVDEIASPRAAVIYKPGDDLSFYFSYGTSYDPSAENLSLSARTADLGPEKDRTFEVGAKAAVLHGQLALTAAVFDTEMTNARVGDPVNASLQVLAGNQRVDGVELGAQGYLTAHWEILAGYTWLDARTTSSTDPTQVGQPLVNTAHHQANVWTTYELGEAWKLGAGLTYVGRRAADMAGQVTIPSALTLDGMVSYRVSRHLTLQLNGYNLTNADYFTNSYYSSTVENHVIPGPGRTVTLTAQVHF